MTDCCAPSSGFPTAGQMVGLATNYPVIWEEICMIQQAVLAASSQCTPTGGQMCTTVGGDTPMTFVSGVKSVTVNNGGSGYFVDTPAVEFVPPRGATPSISAAATVVTNGGSITNITITNPGLGYAPVSSTMTVSSISGSGASLQPLVNAAGQIAGVNILVAGTNYTTSDTIVAIRALASNVAYIDAIFVITSVGLTGDILGIAILNPGSGYEDSVTEVRIVSTLNPTVPYPTGGGFYGTVLVNLSGAIQVVLVNNSGSGYATFPPYLVINDLGVGAQTLVTLTSTSVASINVINPGTNYTSSATGIVFNPPTASLPNPPSAAAIVTIVVPANTFGTTPPVYWNVWSGAATNTAIQLQLNAVLSYFKGLGYTISIKSNPSTGNTILWYICWG